MTMAEHTRDLMAHHGKFPNGAYFHKVDALLEKFEDFDPKIVDMRLDALEKVVDIRLDALEEAAEISKSNHALLVKLSETVGSVYSEVCGAGKTDEPGLKKRVRALEDRFAKIQTTLNNLGWAGGVLSAAFLGSLAYLIYVVLPAIASPLINAFVPHPPAK